MRKIFPLALVFAAVSLLSISCSTDYDASPEVAGKDTIRNPFQGDFTAIVNGVQFTADTKSFTDNTVNNIRSVSFSGTQDSYNKDPKTNSTITVVIPNYTGPHSYAVDGGMSGGGTGMYIAMDSGTTKNYVAKPNDSLSVINITSDGDKWEGSFNFVAAPSGSGDADNIIISQGSFSIPR